MKVYFYTWEHAPTDFEKLVNLQSLKACFMRILNNAVHTSPHKTEIIPTINSLLQALSKRVTGCFPVTLEWFPITLRWLPCLNIKQIIMKTNWINKLTLYKRRQLICHSWIPTTMSVTLFHHVVTGQPRLIKSHLDLSYSFGLIDDVLEFHSVTVLSSVQYPSENLSLVSPLDQFLSISKTQRHYNYFYIWHHTWNVKIRKWHHSAYLCIGSHLIINGLMYQGNRTWHLMASSHLTCNNSHSHTVKLSCGHGIRCE